MSFELIVKCIANGLFFTPKALVTDVGDILTIFIYIVSALQCEFSKNFQTSLTFVIWMPTHIEINSWAQLLMICRAMRPLRVYALIPHIRRVVVELCRGFREILLVSLTLTLTLTLSLILTSTLALTLTLTLTLIFTLTLTLALTLTLTSSLT